MADNKNQSHININTLNVKVLPALTFLVMVKESFSKKRKYKSNIPFIVLGTRKP